MFAGTWVVVRESPRKDFEAVYVYGTLEFEYKKSEDIVFAVTYLLVYGSLFGGWPHLPMENNLMLRLLGNKYTPEIAVPDGPKIGAKAIGLSFCCYYHLKSIMYDLCCYQLKRNTTFVIFRVFRIDIL